MLVPCQLIRLFKLIKDFFWGDQIFKGKYATSMITCFHHYDHLAQDWLRGICEDLGMYFLEGRTADNEDMLNKHHRASMRYFMHEFSEACRHRLPIERKFMPLPEVGSPVFRPRENSESREKNINTEKPCPRTVLLTDEYGG